MKFFEALSLAENEIVALVGAGGKTTTMLAIGKECAQKGLKTILTTTTKIFYPTDPNLKVIISDQPQELSKRIDAALAKNNMILVAKALETSQALQSSKKSNSPGKLLGLNEELFNCLVDSVADIIIIEADGSARKPFKAPAAHEPVIPEASTLVMPIVGIDSPGSFLSSEYVHRPEVIAELTGLKIGDRITPEVVSAVLTSTFGYRKGLPSKARWIPFINKVESPIDLAVAKEVARRIGKEVSTKVLIGSALQEDPIKEAIEL